MAFSTQVIKYGWVALASLGVITGTTIYVANNQRHQVKPEDIIEIAVGTHERCLATQYSTNPVLYHVSPPTFERIWYSNVYTSNGVTVYTNIVTNTIGWHINKTMMVSLDSTIKSLVPYYCDPNTVYDGTTNIVMLTVTGLWASLEIGDKTNKFAREPAWTNPVSTNWIVNYTSYWPSTNGTAININYTSDYRQVVNYAQSWTATGGHVWVTSSNWASQVVKITNAATYGDYPWQIYKEDLEERYKVLNALNKMYLSNNIVVSNYSFSASVAWSNHSHYAYFQNSPHFGWDYIKSQASDIFNNNPVHRGWGIVESLLNYSDVNFNYIARITAGWVQCRVGPFPSYPPHTMYYTAKSYHLGDGLGGLELPIIPENELVRIIDVTSNTSPWEYSAVFGSLSQPPWGETPTYLGDSHQIGWQIEGGNLYCPNYVWSNQYFYFATNIFQYCTNKYW
jgi:hypothetical protein